MAQPTEPTANEVAPVTALITSRKAVADVSIVDHAFTPWKVVPARCNTCGKVAKRHAVVESTVAATNSPETAPGAPVVANQAPATDGVAVAADGTAVGKRRGPAA